MSKKKFWILALVLALSLSLFACGDSAEKEEDPSILAEETEKEDSKEINEEEKEQEEETEEEETEETDSTDLSDDNSEVFEGEVNLYFANAEYVNTGNEDLDKLIVEKREITSEQENLEMALIDELIKGPSDDSKYNLIPESVNLIDVENTDGNVYVNLSSEKLNGGAIEEDFLIRQIVNTLLDLDTTDKITFLVDGEAADSLMGHVSVTEGFTEKFE